MNKIIFSFITLSSFTLTHCTDATHINPRDTLITAIAHNDYGTVAKTLETYIMTQEDKDEFLEIADQMIITAIKWLSKHHRHPEIGIESVKAAGYCLATLTAGAMLLAIIGIVGDAAEAEYAQDKGFTTERLALLYYSMSAAGGLAIMSGFFFYKTVQKAIAAWMKPSQRLENALRIKDAILHTSTI